MLQVILLLVGIVSIVIWKIVNNKKSTKEFEEFNEKCKSNMTSSEES